jgi:hypothetical protein
VARQIPELIAIHREVEQMWVDIKRELRAGMRHIQARSTPLYEQTKLLRVYESDVVPGILQTRGYVRAILEASVRLRDLPIDDVEEGVEARLARQQLVTSSSGANQYSFVIEAGVLTTVFGSTEVMRDQLDFLMMAMTQPHVALGIIPYGRVRTIWPGDGFYIFDEKLVRSAHWTAAFRTNRPDEIATFLKIFALLRAQAVYGPAARELIEAARTLLQTAENF